MENKIVPVQYLVSTTGVMQKVNNRLIFSIANVYSVQTDDLSNA